MEQELDRFRRIFEQVPMGMYLYREDAGGTLVLAGANPAADAIIRVDHRQLVGKTPEQAFPALAKTEIPGRFRAIAREGGTFDVHQLEYADGAVSGAFDFWAFQVAPGEVAVMFTEVSARERADEARRDSEEKYRFLVENQTDLVVKVDTQNRFLFASPSYCRTFGKTEQELLGNTFIPVVHADDREATLLAMRALERPPHTCYVEQRCLTVNGWRWFAWADTAVVDGSGAVQAIIGVGRDITDRRTIEERLRRSEKLEAIGRLAGGVAHDFNNQLTGILGGAEILRRALADRPDLLDVVEELRGAALRSAGLTKQLLAFARKPSARLVAVDVSRLVDEVSALLRRSIDRRIEVRVSPVPPGASVRGGPDRLHAALLNLALNARDAMPWGGVLSIETAIVELDATRCAALPFDLEPGPHVEIAVRDTGVGFSEEARAHLFEPFFTTKELGRGSGLGLAEVYGTVQAHRGAIAIDTAVGKGTSVTVWLPLVAGEASPAARETDPLAAIRPLRVLVADDEPNVRKTLGMLLRSNGHTVLECVNGRDAIARHARDWREVDVVILDLMMPDVGGDEVVVKLLDHNPAARIVISSGYGAAALDSRVAELVFLQKPFTAQQLAAALASALKPERRGAHVS
jgi:PAS domain S-box-containing protein